jgi:hypothetical protein
MNISALSYFSINNNVAKNELIYKFINYYNMSSYKNYFNKIENLNVKLPIVYAIKKYNNKYEFEVYYYRYLHNRKNLYDIDLDDYNNFININDLYKLNPYIKNSKLLHSNFIILSYDINIDFFENNSPIINYYYGGKHSQYHDGIWSYYILEENSNNNKIKRTNEYGLLDIIFNKFNKEKYLVNLFSESDSIIFFSKKPFKKLVSIYIEYTSYNKFIKFLEYFNYDKEIINFCLKTYDNTYKFCVSYDFDMDYNIQKTAIFSIFQ